MSVMQKLDKAGIYNILIMEEKQTILAAGSGSVDEDMYCKDPIRTDSGKETNLVRCRKREEYYGIYRHGSMK